MASVIVLKTRLEEAENALHALMTGAREVKVKIEDYGETTFSETNMKSLEIYIAKLKNEISRISNRAHRRPILFRF